ncbi:MAG TPA: DsrE family protein [Noviherbaspirillum sp.]|nr:DsrE family protein [Noviherbaspirillum sp.]
MSPLFTDHRHATPSRHRPIHSHKILRLLLVIGLALAAPVAAAAGVYVAGNGTSAAQAFEQALAENSRASGKPFWIVVSGKETEALTKGRASADMRKQLTSARERGAEVYVCRADLIRAGIKDEELLDGVVAMYGYDTQDWAGLLPARKEGIVLPADMKQSQLILKTCAGDTKSGV